MSTDRAFDDNEDDNKDVDLPVVELDAASTGAAADSADCDERMKGLPRVLRYAMLISRNAPHIEQRLIAEINEVCPNLPLNAAWGAALDPTVGLTLAADLDRRAVTHNEPNLRRLADCIRLRCLPMPLDAKNFEEYRRVGKALVQAFGMISRHVEESLCCDLEQFVFGWAALPACTDLLSRNLPAAVNASYLGKGMAAHRVAAAKATVLQQIKEDAEKFEKQVDEKVINAIKLDSSPAHGVPDHHLVVARLTSDDVIRPAILTP
jgi:ATP-dependent Lon protease